MHSILSQSLLQEASQAISELMGLNFQNERLTDLARNFAAASAKLGFNSIEIFVQSLIKRQLSRNQLELLASYLTVGETFFFREPESFSLLEKKILPQIAAKRENNKMLRLWSAGCCSGEEPYSLAITCRRAIPDIDDWLLSILATDLNSTFLQKGKAATYSAWSFRGVPQAIQQQYFVKNGPASWTVIPSVRKMVSFAYLNLALDPYPSLQTQTNAMDVILCRNVLMYLTAQHQEKVVSSLYDCLVEGGYLLVNPAETGISFLKKFENENHDGVIIYRKGANGNDNFDDKPYFSSSFELTPSVDFPDHDYLAQESASIDESLDADQQPESSKTPAVAEKTEKPPAPSFEIASKMAEAGSFDAAIIQLEQIAASEPDLARAPILLARLLANTGKLDKSIVWCQKAIKIEPTNPTGYFLQANISNELGHKSEAIAAFKNVLYLDQNCILAHYSLGCLYKETDRIKQAKRHFEISLELLSQLKADEALAEGGGITKGWLQEAIHSMIEE